VSHSRRFLESKSMIAFLPITRYRVEYQVASGRPFSSFERLLLASVGEGLASISKLVERFRIHRRLVVEGLVTLMQAGWVSLGSDEGQFVLTPSGVTACQGVSLPDTIAVSDRHTTVIIEKVTGQVARNQEVDFYSRSKLRGLWDAGVVLRKGAVSNIVDPAIVTGLLPHDATEWIRWIGPISVTSDNAAFAVIDVDTKVERIGGIPKAWEPLLLSECLPQVRQKEMELTAEDQILDDKELRELVRHGVQEETSQAFAELDSGWRPVHLSTDDVLNTSKEHHAVLAHQAAHADAYLAIASPDLSEAGVEDILPALESAIQRGVLVNLFLRSVPSKHNQSQWNAYEKLRKLEYDSTRQGGAGRLAIGTRSTECATGIVFADVPTGPSAVIGTYPWCASAPAEQHTGTSLTVSDPWTVATVCEVLADFSAADERLRLDAGFVRLKKAAGELRREVQSPTATPRLTSMKVLLDRDHEAAVRMVIENAQAQLLVVTSDLNSLVKSGWINLISDAATRLGPDTTVRFTTPTQIPNEITSISVAVKNGAAFVPGARFNGTVIVGDNRAVITTSNRDSASARQSFAARVGIALSGDDVPEYLADSLAQV
jgi:hypothetical protein